MNVVSSYDFRLVILSIAIAPLASYVALDLARRTQAATGRSRLLWLAAGSVTMGLGIWSMHFIGMLAFDKWVGNTDRREALFWRASDTGRYTATFIDQGHCFNGGAWNFPDAPRQGAYDCELVYLDVNGWHCFEPWLTRIETIRDDGVWACAQDVPPEWYDGNDLELEMLIHTLLRRREQVRELICRFHKSSSDPFPAWSSPVPVPGRKVAQPGAAN